MRSIPPGASGGRRMSPRWSLSCFRTRPASSPAQNFVVDGGMTRKMIYA